MELLTIVFTLSFGTYLALSAGSGDMLLWSGEELLLGAVFSLVSAFFARSILLKLGYSPKMRLLHPARWATFAFFMAGPFFMDLAKANFEVAYRLITGRINPGIVRIVPGLSTDLGIAMLANSITLTPGTLTVDVDEGGGMYVHCLNLKEETPSMDKVCSGFPMWVKRIFE